MLYGFSHPPLVVVKKHTGTINGERVEANSIAFIDSNRGVVRHTTVFAELARNFNPLVVAVSWECSSCTLASEEFEESRKAVNLRTLTGGNYGVAPISWSGGRVR